MNRGEFQELKLIVWERDNWTCAYCGLYMKNLYDQWKSGKIKRKTAQITVDHIIPKQAEQTFKVTTLENLTTACWDCNNKKGGREKSTQKL